MRRQIESLALIVTLSAALAADPAANPAADQPPPAPTAPALGTHSVKGIVTSVDAATLVIARSGRRHPNLTFSLCGSTIREGQIAIGRVVSIRYVMNGDTRIATAVSAHPEGTSRSPDRPVTRAKGGT